MLTESTTLRLLHLNSTLMPDSNGPHTRQLNSIGTSSFATITIHDHSVDQAKCIHCDPKTAPQLHNPETFVKILWSSKEQSNVLSSFLSLAKRCHHQRAEWKAFVRWRQPPKMCYCTVHSTNECSSPGITTLVACCKNLPWIVSPYLWLSSRIARLPPGLEYSFQLILQ